MFQDLLGYASIETTEIDTPVAQRIRTSSPLDDLNL